jgi:hypothetical protein
MTYIITIERKGSRLQMEITAPSKPDAIRAVLENFKQQPDPDNKLISIEEKS